MLEGETILPLEKSNVSLFFPFIISIIAHSMFGLQPVIGRYLFKFYSLPPFALLFLSFATLSILYSPRIFLRWRSMNKISRKVIISFIICIVASNACKIFSVKYTKAVYVQLINLLVPFIVSLFAYFLLGERLSIVNCLFLIFTILGAVMVIFGRAPDELTTIELTDTDWIGILLSFGSAFFTALYLLIVKSSSSNAESLTMIQFMSGLLYLIPSLAFQEDLNKFYSLDRHGWIVFFFFSVGYMIGVTSNIYSIGKLGASTVSSLISWRVIVSVLGSWLFLGEVFSTAWQYVGCVIVVVAVTGTWASKSLPLTLKTKSK